MAFVIDASATLPWCFEDEVTERTEQLLDRLSAGEQVFAPAHWPVEVSNALLTAIRKNRIDHTHAEMFWDKLTFLPISVEPPLSIVQLKAVFALCARHGLTFYDGAYLELARRTALPLATFDTALLRAAPFENVSVL